MVFGGGWYEAYEDRQVYLWMEKIKIQISSLILHTSYPIQCVKSIYFNTYWSTFLLDTRIECHATIFSQFILLYSSHVCESMSFVSVIFLNIGNSKKLNGYILSRFRLTITLCLWLYFGPLIFIVLWTKEAIMKNKKFSHIYSMEIK